MNFERAILLPPSAMILLTGVVWLKMVADRWAELRERRIHPQEIATFHQAQTKLDNIQSSDNFRTLFEVPVLFYVLCGYLAITGLNSIFLFACAWLFVALRGMHTYIQLTHNTVINRFRVFDASTAVLMLMWTVFIARLVFVD
jgi:hypothetical protein